ncbi:hypothetical protein BpHYR1_037417 [Brachionus plicatilis]|uniref:Uncharacterized protein n=1 Tax=Brachionus plicatilis TaxID=10195 RepID=A0A3M7SQH2_BRAPC|nr:hypothetical protein BpHYR1_037417 [Brachionus plicatilis]
MIKRTEKNCNIQSCTKYQGLQNLQSLAEIKFKYNEQTFTVDATMNVAPFCIHRIDFRLLEKKIESIILNSINLIKWELCSNQ